LAAEPPTGYKDRAVILRRLTLLCAAAVLLAAAQVAAASAETSPLAGKTGGAILTATQRAAVSAQSVHVHGSLTSGGDSIRVDLHLIAGKGGAGRLTLNGGTVEIVRIGGTVYFRAGAQFWKQNGDADVARLLGGKWVKAPATTSGFDSLTSLTDIRKFFNGLLGSHGKLETGDERHLGAVSVIAVNDLDEGGTLFVAAYGPAYPMKIQGAKDSPGAITFSAWNEPYPIQAPPNPIDFAGLGKTG